MKLLRTAFPAAVIVMTLVWVLLWGDFAPFGILSGYLVAWLIRWRFPMPQIHWPGRFRPIGFARLVVELVLDLVVSSWAVLRLALAREVDLRSGMVRVDLVTDVDLYQVQVAEMISLVPGTVVVELVRSPRSLYLHVLDMDTHSVADIRAMAARVELQVLRAFGSDEELRAFRDHHAEPEGAGAPGGTTGWEADE